MQTLTPHLEGSDLSDARELLLVLSETLQNGILKTALGEMRIAAGNVVRTTPELACALRRGIEIAWGWRRTFGEPRGETSTPLAFALLAA